MTMETTIYLESSVFLVVQFMVPTRISSLNFLKAHSRLETGQLLSLASNKILLGEEQAFHCWEYDNPQSISIIPNISNNIR